jgi:glycogen phosphorylase
MPKIHSYHVVPTFPERIECLSQLVYNLRWSWDHETLNLFRRLDRDLWEKTGHNPVLMLGLIPQERLQEAARDEAFLAHLDRVYKDFIDYMKTPGWFSRKYPEFQGITIAYFSAEFGITECLPIYAGGLGILAGDHLKSASDLGLPLVGVGLLYQQGYFRQYLNVDGWQQEIYPQNDFYNLPIRPVYDVNEEFVLVQVDFPNRKVQAKVWRADVGRVPLILLDTNIPENNPEDRDITDALYGGDREMRIKQELILGIGGIKALAAMGITPSVCHMNEGHSAFLALERARQYMENNGLPYRESRQSTCAGNVFTTHTPVPAGFDLFEPWLVHKYFHEYAAKLGLSFDQMIAFGRYQPSDANEPLNMAVLASKHSSFANGVSRLHGIVTRQMAKRVWANFPDDEIPIGHVTNGVHIPSWISQEMSELLDRYLGPRWLEDPANTEVWNRIDEIPDEELWRTHERRKERLIAFARRRLVAQLRKRGTADTELATAKSILNSEFLTIGFARRFATYKRATLLLRDVPRMMKILTDSKRPVQFLFAGKAHPRDDAGKEFIRQIVHFAQDEETRRRVVFLEDYDITIARYMVQGVDVWLNTPRRPLEASGTSGMKVLANGGLNLSILDGWWDEGYDSEVGWAIGSGEDYSDLEYQDRVESNALYSLLENDVVPLYYNRDSSAISRGWIAKMKSSMKKLCPLFNTNRMVAEYAERFYLPAAQRFQSLTENNSLRACSLVQWRSKIWQNWKSVQIDQVETEEHDSVKFGHNIQVTARISLKEILPQEVSVEIYHGLLDPDRHLPSGKAVKMQLQTSMGGGVYLYRGEIPCQMSGLCGFAIRILPYHQDALIPFEMPLITWEEERK